MDQLATLQRRMHEEASENGIHGVTRLRHLPLLSTPDHLDCVLERALRSKCEALNAAHIYAGLEFLVLGQCPESNCVLIPIWPSHQILLEALYICSEVFHNVPQLLSF